MWASFYNEWRQIPTRHDLNWFNLTAAEVSMEIDRVAGMVDLSLILLGIGVRFCWRYKPMCTNLKQAVDAAIKHSEKLDAAIKHSEKDDG